MKKFISFFLIFIFIFTLCADSASWAAPNKGLIAAKPNKNNKSKGSIPKIGLADKKFLRFQTHQFDPLSGEPPITDKLKIKKLPKDKKGYYIVQFKGPVRNPWKKKVKEKGGRLFSYIPNNAFIVKMAPGQRKKIAELEEVRWVGIYQPAYKVAPSLDKKIDTASEPIEITVQIFNDEDVSDIRKTLESLGGEILKTKNGKYHEIVRVKIASSEIDKIANITGVEWLEEYVRPQLCNVVSAGIMNVPNVWSPGGLTGAGQIAAVCDTGLDVGRNNPSMLDDFEGRIVSAYGLAIPGDWSDEHGHGTHVCGSVLGNGAMSGGLFRGMAYEAGLVIQGFKADALGNVTGLPADLYDLFEPAYNDGARIHSNSWGTAVYGAYDISSQQVDEFAWDHKDMCIHFVSGNSGADADADGVVDLDSLDSPGTAKNCITVGATEGYQLSGGYQYEWGEAWSMNFPVDPIFSDKLSNDPDGMAAFSSRGPTDDGRIKPDVVAPGTNIISCHSQESGAGTLWGAYDSYYSYSGGTSMSTPLVTGCSTLIRQFYTDLKGLSYVSAALIKATLINGALDISPGQYETDEFQEIPDPPRPNNVEGWGRVNLDYSLFPDAPRELDFIDETTGLETGEGHTYFYSVNNASVPLKVTLVYTDYPGTPFTSGQIVNDLDLTVTDPFDTIHYANGGSGLDHVNNVEGIDIEIPLVGTYKISIAGTNVPQGPQPYALVITGGDLFRFTVDVFRDPSYSENDKFFDEGDNVYMQVNMIQGGSPITGASVTATLKISGGTVVEDSINLADQGAGTYRNSWSSAGHTADVYLADIDITGPAGAGEACFHLYSGSGVSSYGMDYNYNGIENYILENKHLIAVYDNMDDTDKLLLYLEQKDTDVSYSFEDISDEYTAGRSEVTSSDRGMLFSAFSISQQGEGLSYANINMTAAPADMPDELLTYYDDITDNDIFSVDRGSWMAQQFDSADIDKDYVLTKVGMIVQKVELFDALGYTEPLIIEIRTDDSGLPGNTILTSETVPPEEVPVGLTWFDVELSSPIVLDQGGLYWLVLKNYDIEWLGWYVYGWWLSYAHSYPGKMAYSENQGSSWTDGSASYDMLFAVYGHEAKPDTSFQVDISMNSPDVDYLVYKLSGFDADLSGAIEDLFPVISGSLGPSVEDDKFHIGYGGDFAVDSLAPDVWTNYSGLTDPQKYIAVYDDSNSNDTVNDNIISWVYFPNANTLNFMDAGAWFEAGIEGIRLRYDTAGATTANEAEYLLVFSQGDYSIIDDWMPTIAAGSLPVPSFMGTPSALSVSVVPTGWPIGELIEGQFSQSGLFTVTNNGSVVETFTLSIDGPSFPSLWTAGLSPGNEIYTLKGLFGATGDNPAGLFSVDDYILIGTPSAATTTQFGDPSLSLNGTNVGLGAQRGLWFDFQAPTSTVHAGEEQSITVNVGAQEP